MPAPERSPRTGRIAAVPGPDARCRVVASIVPLRLPRHQKHAAPERSPILRGTGKRRFRPVSQATRGRFRQAAPAPAGLRPSPPAASATAPSAKVSMWSCASLTAPARSCSWTTSARRRPSCTARAGSCAKRRCSWPCSGRRATLCRSHLDADAARLVRLPPPIAAFGGRPAHVAVSRRRARVRDPGRASSVGGRQTVSRASRRGALPAPRHAPPRPGAQRPPVDGRRLPARPGPRRPGAQDVPRHD